MEYAGVYYLIPIMSFSVLVGLAMDYDIFLMCRVSTASFQCPRVFCLDLSIILCKVLLHCITPSFENFMWYHRSLNFERWVGQIELMYV